MSTRARTFLVVLLTCCPLTVPAVAGAQGSIAPPGKSGADQYFETIPSARGNVAPPAGGSARGLRGTGERALARLGKDGQAAAALAAAGAPPTTGSAAAGAGSQQGRGPAATLGHVLTGSDSGGLGLLLPILAGATLLVALLAMLLRRLRPRELAD
jgi:hypothetical protein